MSWMNVAFLALALAIQPFSCKGKGNGLATPCQTKEGQKQYLFCDVKLGINDRVHALINDLTLEEKSGLFTNTAHGVNRLNISGYEWWNEALHGVARSPGVSFEAEVPYATVFPQVILTSSSFNNSLFLELGHATSTEARIFNNHGHAGLTYWTPNVNLFRDPRWGRGQETPGEDPELTSAYAEHYVKGLQQDDRDPSRLKISACCKHFWGYDMENTHYSRVSYNSLISKQDEVESYMPPFESCVKRGNVSSFMCSYNANNGLPSCADRNKLTGLLRETWGFDGYITGDCGAFGNIMEPHGYTANKGQTIAAAFKAGADLDCAQFANTDAIQNAVSSGHITEDLIDKRLFQLFRVQFRLGMFDPYEIQPFRQFELNQLRSPAHLELSKEAARQGMVLLKNENHALPLKGGNTKILVAGPLASDEFASCGNYYGPAPKVWSPLEGIKKYATSTDTVQFVMALDNVTDDSKNFTNCTSAAQESDIVVLVIGIDQKVEREDKDRKLIDLPGAQKELVQETALAAKQSNPRSKVILVVVSGGALDIGFAKEAAFIDSIIWMGYAGEFAGLVLAEILYGKTNPSGRLTQTFYPADYVNQVSMLDMRFRPDPDLLTPGRGYRFYNGDAVYKFGDGLSYNSFVHELEGVESVGVGVMYVDNAVDDRSKNDAVIICADQAVKFTTDDRLLESTAFSVMLRVSNPSDQMYGGERVVLAFLEPLDQDSCTQEGLPKSKLVSYARTEHLLPGQDAVVKLDVKYRHLLHVNVEGNRELIVPHRHVLKIEGVHVAINFVSECSDHTTSLRSKLRKS